MNQKHNNREFFETRPPLFLPLSQNRSLVFAVNAFFYTATNSRKFNPRFLKYYLSINCYKRVTDSAMKPTTSNITFTSLQTFSAFLDLAIKVLPDSTEQFDSLYQQLQKDDYQMGVLAYLPVYSNGLKEEKIRISLQIYKDIKIIDIRNFIDTPEYTGPTRHAIRFETPLSKPFIEAAKVFRDYWISLPAVYPYPANQPPVTAQPKYRTGTVWHPAVEEKKL